MQSSAGSSP